MFTGGFFWWWLRIIITPATFCEAYGLPFCGKCRCDYQGPCSSKPCVVWLYPFLASFLCSAGIAVGFYGNGETSDGIHRLTYSLRHANRTVAGVQDRVSTDLLSTSSLKSACACGSSLFFVSFWAYRRAKTSINGVVISSALLKISKQTQLVK